MGPPASHRWVAYVPGTRGRGQLNIVADEGGGPATAAYGSCRVLFAGRLFNRADVASALEEQPGSEAELVLAAYRRFGEDVVRRFRGIFCFALWDAEAEVSLCVRDQVGVHPLFYAELESGVLISPSIAELVADSRVPDEINRTWVAGYIVNRWTSVDETFFSAVRRLPPGHFLRGHRGRRSTARYWQPDERPLPADARDLAEEFEGRALQAVARCLDEQPAAVLLSGGLDSASVAAVAADVAHKNGLPRPLALSVVIPPPEDEGLTQARIARSLGLTHLCVHVGYGGDETWLLEATNLAASSGLPPIAFAQTAYDSLIGDARERGARIILGGHGGDEWLFHPGHAADRVRRLDIPSLYRLWRAYYGYYPRTLTYSLRAVFWDWSVRMLISEAVRYAGRIAPSWYARRARTRMESAMPAWFAPDPALRDALRERWTASQPHERRDGYAAHNRRRALSHSSVIAVLEHAFVHGRELGVRIEHPFFDIDVVEFMHRVPFEVHTHNGEAKWLARRLLKSRLPDLAERWPRTVYGTNFVTQITKNQGTLAWKRSGGVPLLGELGVVDRDLLSSDGGRLQVAMQSDHSLLFLTLVVDNWLRARRISSKGGGNVT